jgi:uncharacterized membrane protein
MIPVMSTATQSNGSRSATSAESGARTDEQRLAELLGWASLGLGVSQATSPGRFDRFIGVRPDPKPRAITVVACGVRELAAAAGILAIDRPRPAGWLWARVAGDTLDLALLVMALRNRPERPARIVGAIGAVVGIAATDLYAAVHNTRRQDKHQSTQEEQRMEVTAAITVRRSPEEVYAFWRDFENLPRFMYHLEAVEPSGPGRSRWKAKAPLGSVGWEAEVTEDRPNERIAWRSLGDSKVDNSGSVRFSPAPRDQGTEIRLELRYDAPGGALGAALAKFFGEEPRQQVKDDLRRFKQVMETGQVVRSDGSPEGQTARRQLKQRPAHPPEPEVVEATSHLERSFT